MATSGTVGEYTFTVAMLLEQAIIKTGAKQSDLTAQTINTAEREFNLMLSSFANRGINLWTIEQELIGLNYGQGDYTLPLGTLDILNINLRTMNRLTGSGTATSSEAGTVEYAFDSDTDTILTQTAPAGNVQYDFGTEVTVQTFGYLPGATSTMSLVVEYSTDGGVSWVTALTIGSQNYQDGVWAWYDLSVSYAARFWRARESATGTIVVREMFFGDLAYEVPITRMNKDDYWNLPGKQTIGSVVQFWFDRRRQLPIIHLWNVPNNTYQLINLLRNRHIQDVTGIRQEVEVPQRWQDFLMWGLAKRLVTSGIGDINRYSMIKQELAEVMFDGEAEEKDDSDINWYPNIGAYTRG